MASEVLPLQKGGGGRKSVSYAEGGGGHNKFEVVLTRELENLAILMGGWGGGKMFPPFNRGDMKSFTLS